MSDERIHYSLIAGEVIFTVGKGRNEERGMVHLNVMAKFPHEHLTLKNIEQIQAALFSQLQQDMNNQVAAVQKITILNRIYLGAFTEAEFVEGTALEGKPANDA